MLNSEIKSCKLHFRFYYLSLAVLADRNFDHQDGEMILDDEEEAQVAGSTGNLPAALKLTIKFAYDQGLKEELGDQDFNDWIAGVFTHTQVHFQQADSLGTQVIFEVYSQIK